MTYMANKKAYSLLESLTYWMAEISYCREKDPDDIGFLDKADKTIHFLFGQLWRSNNPILPAVVEGVFIDIVTQGWFGQFDRAGVPFWAQNSALAIGENWREYEKRNLRTLFTNKGILEG